MWFTNTTKINNLHSAAKFKQKPSIIFIYLSNSACPDCMLKAA